MEQQFVVLVDEQDAEKGKIEKLEAHRLGVLHRAFSIFIFDHEGRMLLQRRSNGKYHSAGLWSNACCGHPVPGEEIRRAAHRRLNEELGIDTVLDKSFDFIYRAELANGLIEHEFDHVFIGTHNGIIPFNTAEVSKVMYIEFEELKMLLDKSPEQFTAWFRIVFPRIELIWKKS